MTNTLTSTEAAAAAAAQHKLTMALLSLATQGERTPCGDPVVHDYWMSDFEDERTLAVRMCRQCPVIEACGEAARTNYEPWGVWGGADRSPRRAAAREDKAA